MEFEDWTRAVHEEFEQLRQQSRHKRRVVMISAVSAIFLVGAVLFAVLIK